MTPSKLPLQLFDKEKIKITFKLLYPGSGYIEVRVIGGSAQSGFFDDPDKLIDALSSVQSFKGCYVVMNPLTADPTLLQERRNQFGKGKATKDCDIVRRHRLLIDCDPQRESGVSATHTEKLLAKRRADVISKFLTDCEWPEPVFCDSGNGYHLLYRIDEPAKDDGLVKRSLMALAARFNDEHVHVDTSVHNASRITKLYGTMACKGQSSDQRPHRISEIISIPRELDIVTHQQLESLAAEHIEQQSDLEPEQSTQDGAKIDLPKLIQSWGLKVGKPSTNGDGWTNYTLKQSPLCDHHGDGVFIGQHTSGALQAMCQHDSCTWGWPEFRAHMEQETGVHACKGLPEPLMEFQPFPTEAMPMGVQGIIRAGAKAIGCDETYIALPALTAMAAAIGDSYVFCPKPGWYVPSIIWTAILGDSGAGKSPAFDLIREPFVEMARISFDEFNEASAEFTIAKLKYEIDKKEWKKKGGKGSVPAEPVEPVMKKVLLQDFTLESVLEQLGHNPRGMLLATDELSQFITGLDRYKSGSGSDLPIVVQFYGARSYIHDRKGKDDLGRKHVIIPCMSVGITGCIQPGIFARYMTPEKFSIGLVARFLIANPPEPVRVWTDDHVSVSLQRAFGKVVNKLCSLKPAQIDNKTISQQLRMSKTAKSIYADFYNRHNQEKLNLSPQLKAAWAKLEEHPFRIAMILHLADMVKGEVSDAISAEVMERAIRLTEWFKYEARRAYMGIEASPEQRALEDVLDRLRRVGGSATVRELQRSFDRKYKSDEIQLRLQQLVGCGLCTREEIRPEGKGRPTTRYVLRDEN